MSRARIKTLAALVSELRARKVAEAALPLAAAELEAAGFKVYPFPDGDCLAVDQAPGLDAKLDDLHSRGIRPGLVCVLRDLGSEDDLNSEHASGTAETAKASKGRGRGGGVAPGSQTPTIPANPDRKRRARVTDPPTKRRRRNDV